MKYFLKNLTFCYITKNNNIIMTFAIQRQTVYGVYIRSCSKVTSSATLGKYNILYPWIMADVASGIM